MAAKLGLRIEPLLARIPHWAQNTRVEIESEIDLSTVVASCGDMLARVSEIVKVGVLGAMDAKGDATLRKRGFAFSEEIWRRGSAVLVPYGFSSMRLLWQRRGENSDRGCEGSLLKVGPDRNCYVGFNTFGSMGRLGNQLFQYAALRGIGTHIGCHTTLLPMDLHGRESEGQRTLFAKMFPNVKAMREGPEYQWSHEYSEPPDEMYDFDESVLSLPINTNFAGYFQSFRYFCNVREELRTELSFATGMSLSLTQRLMAIKALFVKEGTATLNSPLVGVPCAGVHVRRGDASSEVWFSLPPVTYIHNAMDLLIKAFPDPPIFVVVSGGSRTQGGRGEADMAWCKHHIRRPNVHFEEGADEVHDFGILAHCTHHIVTWWPAYLANGLVVAWRQWSHHPQYSFKPGSYDREDNYFPPHWILLDSPPSTS